MLNRFYLIIIILFGHVQLRACADSVIAALPFFHAATLDETMGDDWSFQNYPNGVDYAYELTLSTQRNLYIDTCDTLTNFDTIVSIKDACGNEVSIIESDDGEMDFCPESGIPDTPWYASIIDSITLEAGTYYIVVDGYSGTTGNYAVAVGTLPSIVSSAIAEDNSYLEIRFSEGMYTEATGNGALETSDFEISFNQNGGTATGVYIMPYMTNTSGGALEGGEDTVRFAIAVQGESTGGLEQVTVRTQSNASIFNSFGIGLLRSASITQNLSDQIAPFMVSSNPADGAINIATNTDIVIDFSEPIRNNEESDLNNSNSTNSIELNNADSGESIDYSISTANNQSFTIDPDSDLPEFSYIHIIISNIQDTNGNELGDDTIQFQTADVDTIGPIIINHVLNPFQANIFEDLTISVDLEDDTGIDEANLFYMKGDDSGFSSVAMTDSSGTYTGTIPDTNISLNGLFYYVVAQDLLGQNTTSDTIGVSVRFSSGSLRTNSVTNSAYPNGIPQNRWRLISIPGVLDDTDLTSVLGDELGAKDNNIWRIFEYDQNSNAYADNPENMLLTESYWLYHRVGDNLSVSVPAGETGDMSGTGMTLKPGWNFIGSPYAFPITLELNEIQFYGPVTYGMAAEEWSSVVAQLNPWNGYLVYNRTVSDKTIVLDPSYTGVGLAARSLAKEEGWLMTLQVTTEEYQDRFNTIGALLSANDERDWHDNPEITAPGKSISLFFTIPDEEVTNRFTSDVRALDGRIKAWDARIRVKNLQVVTYLSWTIDQALEMGQAVQLMDLSTRRVVDMLSSDYLSMGMVDTRYDRQIKIISGDPAEVALAVDEILAAIPEELSIQGNYPNPFNPVTTIRFGLPEPRQVRLSVMNMLGQEVAELLNGWKNLGHHEIRWQSLDDQGMSVASGVYFAVLNDGTTIDVQKMILLK